MHTAVLRTLRLLALTFLASFGFWARGAAPTLSSPTAISAPFNAPYNTQLTATGGTAPYSFSVSSGAPPGGIFISSSGAVSGVPQSVGDYAFTILITDFNGNTGTASLDFTVTQFGLTGPTQTSALINAPFSYFPQTNGGGAAPITYTVTSPLPTGLTFNSTINRIVGTPTALGSSTVTVTATDKNGLTSSQSLTINVNPLLFTGPLQATFIANTSTFGYQLQETGGTPPYTFTITNGTLPSGITLSANGLLSGTSTSADTIVPVTISIHDSAGTPNIDQINLSVSVQSFGMPSPQVSSGTVGSPFSFTVTTPSGGVAPLTVSGNSSLPGVSFDPSALTFSGVPTSGGNIYSYLNVIDHDGNYAATTTVLVSLPVTPLILSAPATNYTVPAGISVFIGATAAGGVAPYTYTLASGTLPTGMTFNPNDGIHQIQGSSTAIGSYPVTLMVTDAMGSTATVQFPLTVAQMAIDSTPTATAASGVFFAYNAFEYGGIGQVTWSASGLPPGLTMNSGTGQIEGVTTVGSTSSVTFPVMITAKDSTSATATMTLQLTVQPVVVSLPNNFTAIVGLPYSYQLSTLGGSQPYTYALATGGSLPPGFTLSSSGLITGTATATTGALTFAVTATDSSGSPHSATASAPFYVNSFGVPSPIVINGTLGASLSFTIPVGGGTPPYTFSGSANTPGLTFNSATGVLSGIPTGAGTFLPNVQVTDSNHNTSSASLSVVIPAAPLSVSAGNPANNAVVNNFYNNQIIVSGGVAPYTYALTSGSLPTGAQLSQYGDISGTLTATGSYSPVITVTDSDGTTATLPLTIAVGTFGITSGTPPAVAAGEAYSQQFFSSGGTGNVTYTATNLPAGLTMSSGGTLSGTTSAAPGIYQASITVSDTAGHTVTNTYDFTVQAVVGTSPGTFSVVTGTPYSYQLSASGVHAPFTYAITSGTLPAGLTLSSSGLLSGTTNVSSFSGFIAYSITDKAGNTVAGPGLNLTTKAFGIVLPMSPPVAVVDAPYSYTVPVAGGTGPYTFTASSLPTGLTLNAATGVISGAATFGSKGYNVTISVTDSASHSDGPDSLTLVLQPGTFAAYETNPSTSIVVNASYTNYFTYSGGYGPVTIAVTSGSLPSWLSLTNNELFGTPTTTGSYSFTISVTDATGASLTFPVNLAVGNYGITTTGTTTGAVGLPYFQTFSTSGLTAPLTWSATGLPAGLTMNAANGLISGTPTAASSSAATITITDSSSPTPKVVSTPEQITIQNLTTGNSQTLIAIDGTAYSDQLAVAGASGPYTFVLTGSTVLPAGLSFSSNGVVSGTATTASSTATSYGYTVIDPNGDAASGSFTLATHSFGLAAPLNTPAATALVPYSYTLTATGGTPPYTYSSTTLPSGLVLNPATGLIYGTPTVGTRGTNVTITVTDNSATKQTATATLPLVINPAPLAFYSAPAVTFLQNSTVNSSLYVGGGTGSLYYAVTSGTLPPGLALTTSGSITGTATTAGTYPVTLMVTDAASVTATLNVTFTVASFAFASPSTSFAGAVGVPYTFTSGTIGGTGTISYSATGLPPGLSIVGNGSTATISGTPSATGTYVVSVIAQDSSSPAKTAAQSLTITVRNVIFSMPTTFVAVNQVPYSFQLVGAGGIPPYTYAISSGTLPSGLSLSSTGLISGTTSTTTNTSANVTFFLSDSVGNSVTLTEPFYNRVFGINSPQVATAAAGTAFSFTPALGGGTPPYTIASTSGLPTGLSLNAATGQISGTTPLGGSFTETLTSTDSTTPTAQNGITASIVLNLTPLPLTVTYSGAGSVLIGTAYSSSSVAVAGGVLPYNYAVTAGSLPPGMTLSSTGAVSGTPSAGGSYSAQITVTDHAGTTASVTVPITVKTFGFSFGALNPTYAAGAAYSYDDSAIGGVGAVTYSATNLPPGLTYNAATGRFAGVPTTAGTYVTTFTATDSTGASVSTVFHITVVPLEINGSTGYTAVAGGPFSFQLNPVGGTAPYTFALAAGSSLPPGLTLSSSGLISGTATTVTTTAQPFTVQLTDSASPTPNTATLTGNFFVSSFGIQSPIWLNASLGSSFSYTLLPVGGTPPYTFSGVSAVPGLTFNAATGVLAGTPTAAGTSTFSLGIYDSNATTGVAGLRVTVAAPLTAAQSFPATNLVVNSYYGNQLSVSGGVTPYSYFVTSGSLPPGISLNQNGYISGLPSGTGSYSAVITIIDGYANSTKVTLPLVVRTFGLSTAGIPNVAAGVAYVNQFFTSGSTGTVTYSATGLPTGLTMTSGGSIVGTTGATGNYSVAITASDTAGDSVTNTYNLSVEPIVGTSPSTFSAVTGSPYSYQLTASGANGPFTYAITSGSLPTGLTLSSSGLLSGTTNVSGFIGYIGYAISDSAGHTINGPGINLTTKSFGIPAPLPTQTIAVGAAYSYAIPVAGGTGALSFSSTGLPTGLTLNTATGVISGSPTFGSHDYNINVSVSDSASHVDGPETITFVLQPAALTAYASNPAATAVIGNGYSNFINYSGGYSPYTVTLTGSLAPGLSFSNNEIYGTLGSVTGSYPSAVTVTDSAGTAVTVNTSLAVASYGITSLGAAAGAVNVPYYQNFYTSGLTSPLTWTATGLPPGLTMGLYDGLVSGTPTTAGMYTATISVTDSSATPKTSSILILFTIQVLTTGNSQVLIAIDGAPYSDQLTAAGGTGSYTFALSGSAQLPPGLSLSPTGVISGTPTTSSANANGYNYTVTDSNGNVANGSFSLSTPSFGLAAPLTPPTAYAGTPYSYTLAAVGGTAPYTYAVSNLPAGLALNSATGVISGTPTTGNRSFSTTVTVTDSSATKQTATAPLAFTIIPQTLAFFNPGTVGALLNGSFSDNLVITGGSGSVVFTFTGSLPPGLTMSTSGLISGTATTAGIYPVTFTATDGAGATATLNLTFSVSPFGFSPSVVSFAGAVGVPYSYTATTTGGTGTITYTASGLPPGLSVSSGGANALISGTPTAVGTYAALITAQDSSNPAKLAYQVLSVTIRKVVFVDATNFIAVSGVPYSYQLTVAGGTAPYTYAVSSGALPAGLTLGSSGLISGTTSTTVNTSTTPTFTATDSVGNSVPLAVTFNNRIFGVNSPQVVSGTAGTAINFTPALGGGTSPYTIAASGLPAGLSINSASGAITGTTQLGGSFQTNITSTDSSSPALTGLSATFFLNLTPLPLTASFGGPATQLVNSAYGSYNVAVTGGVTPYTYTITAGSLPPGISMSLSGAISGTPTATGSYSAQVTVTDHAGTTALVTVPIAVSTFGFSFGALSPTYVIGQPYSYNDSVTGGVGAITYSAANLPPGLTYNAATGQFAGSPTTAGSYVTTLTATDSTGASVSTVFHITVVPLEVNTTLTANAIVGVPYSYQIQVIGGTAPYTFTLPTGTVLPTGLSFSTSGLISGTASAARTVANLAVTIADSSGLSITSNFTVSALSFGLASPQIFSGTYGSALSAPLSAGGGTAPYTFSTTATLPTGLSLNSASGVISGTPTAAPGTYVDTFTVTDHTGLTSSASIRLQLAGIAPVITGSPAPVTVTAGNSATFSVTAAGPGAFTYQWFKNGSLLGATGPTLTLANVPLGSGGEITATVTSVYGSTNSSAALLTVNPIAPVLPAAGSDTAVEGSAFTYTPPLNGTNATFTITPALPAGLTLNSSTGVISGTATAPLPATPFTLTATNVSGSSSENLTLTVDVPLPVITTNAVSGTAGTAMSVQIAASNSPTNFSATGLPSGLSISPTGLVTGTPVSSGSATVMVTATNATGSATDPVVFTIAAAPSAPVYTGASTSSGTEGSTFAYTPTFTGNATSFALASGSGALPTGLTLNTSTGAITGTAVASGTFEITLAATGTGGTTQVPLTITINPSASAPVINSASSVSANAGSSFSFALSATNNPTSYATFNLPSWATLTGNVISGTPVAGTTTVGVLAVNGSGFGPTSALIIQINPAPSTPIMTSDSSYTVQVGSAYSFNLSATSNPTAYVVTSGTLPDGLSLSGGTLSGTPLPDAASGTVGIAAVNSSGQGLALLINFVVTPSPTAPVVTSSGSEAGQVGQLLAYQIVATNSPTGYAVAGNLPAGLTLDPSSGLITGIPTAATTTPVTVTVTASSAQGSGSKNVAFTINPPPAAPTVASATTASGQVGTAFNYQIAGTSGATLYVATPLPGGLSVDPSTGIISGTPTMAGTYSVSLQAGNAGGLGAATTLSLVIAAAPSAPVITSAPTVVITAGSAFTYAIAATSSATITGYGLTGTLPTGLTVNTVTGIISGTPVIAGTSLVQVTATSSAGTSLPQSVAITVNANPNAPVVTSAHAATGQVGVPFSFTLTASGLAAAPFPPDETLDAVGLPAGLGVNPSTGLISGTPTQSGVYPVTVVGQNQFGEGPADTLTIAINPPDSAPGITSATAASAQAGVPFSYQIIASNSPTSFDAVGAPAWLVLSTTTGALSGTPTAPGTYTVNLVASNTVAGQPVPLVITVSPAANTPVVTSSLSASGTLSSVFTPFQITCTPAATSYSASNLPPGLSLDPSTGIISGTPTASGTFAVPLTGTNANGQGATITLTITIQGSLSL